MSLLTNILEWFKSNISTILSGVTIANVTGFIIAILQLRKNNKNTKNNTECSYELNETLKNTNELQKEVCEIQETSKNNSEEIQYLNDKCDLLVEKLNAILEIQSIVYSTINNDTIRNNVSNIITTAKLKTVNFKKSVYEKSEQVSKLIDENKKDIEEIIDTAKNTVTTIKESVNNVLRG